MFSVFKRPFGSPNAVIYSYEVSKLFLDKNLSSILEVGCGIGIFAFRYAAKEKNVFVMAVDQSEQTVNFMSSNYEKHYKNLELKICDFCDKDLSLGRNFEAVYSSDVLEHVTEPKLFVANIFKHLTAGGKAVVNFPNETNHGINHFAEVCDVQALFASFSDIKVFAIDIRHPLDRLWFTVRSVYENLFSRSTKAARAHLYHEREEQGIDSFEESTCFQFISDKGKVRNLLASAFAEIFLLVKPTINVRQILQGSVINNPRLVVVAMK